MVVPVSPGGLCALLVIGLVHCDNRLGSAIAMGLFATGVATSVLLIATHDRPFTGQISISTGAAAPDHAGDTCGTKLIKPAARLSR